MECPTCNTPMEEDIIEKRTRFRCPKCHCLQYERRKTTDGYHCMVDDIADDVATKGAHEELTVGLINTCFRAEQNGASYSDKILEWCKMHGFKWETFDGKDAHGKKAQFSRFTRDRRF